MYLLTSRDYCKKKLVISTDLTDPESVPEMVTTNPEENCTLEKLLGNVMFKSSGAPGIDHFNNHLR